uniref:Reverse transcriptase domain-containing protein n=1 Tax=Tanacetum cinerariifolium TaxID=118510 RepID=A0A6L2M837_TANCI|nr:reverse transcriptase domain-containing protein [Tanacetum cinerariifolium]
MPVWCRMFQQTLDGLVRGWFERLPRDNINEWTDLRDAFVARYSVRRTCFKEPHEITKIIRRANGSLTAFKERWKVEIGFIMGVPEVMKIIRSWIQSSHPSWLSAFRTSNELPKGETREAHRKTSLSLNGRDARPFRRTRPGESQRDAYRNSYRGRDAYRANRIRDDRAPYLPLKGEYNRRIAPDKKRKVRETTELWMNIPITFLAISTKDISEEPLIVKAEVEGYVVRRVYVDEGSSAEVMFEHCFENLSPKIKVGLRETQTELVGFDEEVSNPLRKIELEVFFGNGGLCRRTSMKFIVVRAPSPYNIIIGRPGLNTLCGIPSTIHAMMKFLTPKGVATLVTRTVIIMEGAATGHRARVERESFSGYCVPKMDNIFNGKEHGSSKRAFPKDYYPLSNTDCKVESVMGFKYTCFLDAYKGYQQIQMAKEDEEKKAFYTDQGTYCYTKLPFDLNNTGATYQRLVDLTFQSQIGRNLEAYVDDMMQSLSGKLAALNRFIAKSAKRRLRRYFEAHPVKVITDQPIKNILNNTETSGKLAKYVIELGVYNITFVHCNAVKGPGGFPLRDFVHRWSLWIKRIGGMFGSDRTSGIEYTYALRLTFSSTNNEAEYEALLAGLRIACRMNISNIEVKVDSKLVASQINGSYETSKDSMMKYLAKAKEYAYGFKSFSIKNIPRNTNQKANVLSKLASVAFNHLTKEVLVEVLNERSREGQEIHTIVEEEGDNWMTPIRWCLKERIWPKDMNEA